MLVSAAMIVKNESRCIIRCLSSIIDAVDEIVIVDTGSTDNTVELIEDFRKDKKNVRLYYYEWNDDFSAARNFSVSKARGEWKFIIDADEFLHPDDVNKVRECCKIAGKDLRNVVGDIQLIDIKNFEIKAVVSKGVSRLFTGGLKFRGKIHEHLSNDYVMKGARVQTPIRLFHDGYDPGAVNMARKGLRNLKILEKCMQEEPDNFMYQLYFARQVSGHNDEMALFYLNKAERLYRESGIKDDIVDGFIHDTRLSLEQSQSKMYTK